jgi:hypothetical protein
MYVARWIGAAVRSLRWVAKLRRGAGNHDIKEPLYRKVGVRNGPTIKPIESKPRGRDCPNCTT